MALSVVDHSPIAEGSSADEALRATARLAPEVDELGFTRYWVAEHHGSASFASSAPEILTATLLSATKRMRIGPGGVILPQHDPGRVAESFGVLSALYPGRIDLGVVRGSKPAPDYPERLRELHEALDLSAPGRTEVWLLGSAGTAEHAARWRACFCVAYLGDDRSGDAIATYLGDLEGDDTAARPRTALAVRVLVGESAADAERLTRAYLLWRSRKDLGTAHRVPAPETVRRHRWTSAEQERADANQRTLIAGTPEQVRRQLLELVRPLQVDELVVNTITHDPADRLQSYRLLADIFDLCPAV